LAQYTQEQLLSMIRQKLIAGPAAGTVRSELAAPGVDADVVDP
jgi:hypothetical protein